MAQGRNLGKSRKAGGATRHQKINKQKAAKKGGTVEVHCALFSFSVVILFPFLFLPLSLSASPFPPPHYLHVSNLTSYILWGGIACT